MCLSKPKRLVDSLPWGLMKQYNACRWQVTLRSLMHKQVVVLSEARFATPKVAFERSLLLVRGVVRTLLARTLGVSFEV
jgi:hypothetical protein